MSSTVTSSGSLWVLVYDSSSNLPGLHLILYIVQWICSQCHGSGCEWCWEVVQRNWYYGKTVTLKCADIVCKYCRVVSFWSITTRKRSAVLQCWMISHGCVHKGDILWFVRLWGNIQMVHQSRSNGLRVADELYLKRGHLMTGGFPFLHTLLVLFYGKASYDCWPAPTCILCWSSNPNFEVLTVLLSILHYCYQYHPPGNPPITLERVCISRTWYRMCQHLFTGCKYWLELSSVYCSIDLALHHRWIDVCDDCVH